jgi:two-component system nitrate/nitrite response regulator NarL
MHPASIGTRQDTPGHEASTLVAGSSARQKGGWGVRKVAVVGDHRLASTGIAALLTEEDGLLALGPHGFEDWRSRLMDEDPDAVLVVSRRRGFLPAQLIREMRQYLPEARMVFVSLVEDDEALLAALQSGVEGALDINADAGFLVRCIHDVLRGEVVVSPAVAKRLVGEYSALASGIAPAPKRDVLTPREVGILRLIAEGESNKEIARQLSISEHTVRAHARSIMRKLDVANRVQAAAVALRSGLAAS